MKSIHRNITSPFVCAVLFTAAAGWPARADYTSTVQSHSPVGYWQFQETGPSPAPHKLANSGSLGSIADAYANATVSAVPGKINNAALFVNGVGTGHCDSRANVVYNPILASPMFTVEFWAQPGAGIFNGDFDTTGACPLSNFNPNNFPGGRVGWLFYLAPNGQWNFRLGLTSGYAAGGNLIATTGSGAQGVWQHIAATYDGNTVNLYINGTLAVSSPSPAASTGWVPNTGSFLRFGGTPLPGDTAGETADGDYYAPVSQATPPSGNRGWDGLLDEVAIYTNVLSAAKIAAHYAAASTPATYGATILADHPVGYWNFDEAAVTPPNPGTLPILANSGSAASAAEATNEWGAVIGQPGPGYTGFAAADKAVTFNLSQSSLTVQDAAALHFGGNITMAAWVKPSANNYMHDIIEHGFDGTGAETFLRIMRGYGYGTGQYYELGATDGENGDGWYDSVLVPMPPGDIGNWVFVAGTFDGSNWNLYRNGLLLGSVPPYSSSTDQDTGNYDVTNTWTIGSRALPGIWDGNNFAGSIAEPAIFTTALSAADIMALYNAALVPPVLTGPLVNPGTVYVGTTVPFSIWAEGSGTLSYQWTSNGVPLAVTTTNFTIDDISLGNYTIAVTVRNAYGTNTSSVAFTAVNAPPSITSPIYTEWRFVGFPFDFTVGAAGTTPLTYFWYLGNTLVQAGASPTYSGTASLANAGTYSVVVSNVTGVNATSGPVVLNSIPVPGNYPGAVAASDPIAYWRLGETSGTVAHDVIGGNDGTYFSATLGVPGYSVIDPDTAVSFSGVNSYVGNISGTAINFPGHTSFTLEAWVKAPSGQSDEATIIAKGIGETGTTRTEQFSVDVAGGAYRFFTANGTADNAIIEADASSGPNNSWQHIVAVYDDLNILGDGTNMYIYVNGVLEGQHATRPGGVINTTSAVSIGSKRTGNDPNYDGTFNGTVDEVAVYNYPLSAATIQAHYAAAYGSSVAPFIAVPPSPTTNYAGLPLEISVVAAGTQPLSYQWKMNGTDISGATDSSFVISPATFGDAGTYWVGITNSVGGIASVPVPVVVLPAPSSPPAIPGLVLHLPFNGNLNDATGRGNNGTGYHSTTNIDLANSGTTNVASPSAANDHFNYVSPGALGNGSQGLHYASDAVNTGGTTSIGMNDWYVNLGVRPDLQFSSNVNFSVAFWIRLYPLGFQGGDLPFFTDAKGSEGNNGFVFAPAYAYGTADPNPTTDPSDWAGCWAFTIYGGGVGIRLYGSNLGTTPGTINDGNWHHLVHVFDRQADTSVTYLDGLVATYLKEAGTTLNSAGDIDTGNPAIIGQDPTGLYGETGAADIEDLGVWRKALSPLEAASIYVAAVSNQLSYVSAPITLSEQRISNTQLMFTWPAGTLQSSTNVTGPYINVTPVSPYTNTISGNMFFRVRL